MRVRGLAGLPVLRWRSRRGENTPSASAGMALKEIVQQAFTLFSLPSSCQVLSDAYFTSGLQALTTSVTNLRPIHLGLDDTKLRRLLSLGRSKVLYMGVVDSQSEEVHADPNPASVMTMAAFMLKPGARLPLHDHPKMYGLLKLVHGQLEVQSYSSVRCLAARPGQSIPQLLCRKLPLAQLDCQSPVVQLHKNYNDIHEIYNASKDELAVFVDIMSPPYDFRRPEDPSSNLHADSVSCPHENSERFSMAQSDSLRSRSCGTCDETKSLDRNVVMWSEHSELQMIFWEKSHRYITYYKEVGPATPAQLSTSENGQTDQFVVLEETPCPMDFYTDHLAYTGPSLT